MAIFDQRAELNKQDRHTAASWDDSFGLKLLGYNQYGKNNAWGHLLSFVPGVNTGRHALAMGTSSGDTKNVLKDTFDETVGRDLATAGFAINLAKTIGTGGASALAGGASGAAAGAAGAGGSGLMGGMFAGAKGSGKMAGLLNKTGDTKTAADAMSTLSGAKSAEVDPALASRISEQIASSMVNPYQQGTPEYEMFESKKMDQEGGLQNKFKSLNVSGIKDDVKGFMKSATTGNIFESAGNMISTSVADYQAKEDAFQEYAKGTMTQESFNYL